MASIISAAMYCYCRNQDRMEPWRELLRIQSHSICVSDLGYLCIYLQNHSQRLNIGIIPKRQPDLLIPNR